MADITLSSLLGGSSAGTNSPTFTGILTCAAMSITGDDTHGSYGESKFITGNGWGRINHAYYGIQDSFTLSSNYKRTGAATGTIDSASMGTAEIGIFGVNGGAGQISLRVGNANTAPTEVMSITAATTTLTSQLVVSSSIKSTGAGGGIFWSNRSGTARDYAWYADGNNIRLNVSTIGDVVTITEAGHISAGVFTGNQVFQSSNAVAILATTGAGGVYLRPNGAGSATGQVTIDGAGNVVAAGYLTATGGAVNASNYFVSSTVNFICGPTGAGALYFRPNGVGSTTGQCTIDANGMINAVNLTVSGTVYSNSWFRSYAATGWYNETYGGGIYMADTSYVRTYNNKTMIAADFLMSSDASLKTTIKDYTFKLPLRPVSFDWIESGKSDVGFIANDVEVDYPELVDYSTDSETGITTRVLSYPKLTVVLSAQINTLQARIDELENTLLTRMAELERKLLK